MDNTYLDIFIENAIAEDIGERDITSHACIPQDAFGKAQLLVKDYGVIAGVEIAKRTFEIFDNDLKMDIFVKDGTKVKPGDVVFTIDGKVLSILQIERLVLNVMQRMSGIATETNKYVEAVMGLHTKILDTRKTSPNMRLIEKLAVKIGGGENHRMGLYDMVLIKDNHIDFAGGISQAIKATKKYLTQRHKEDVKIEIEARSIEEVEEILESGNINRIMLDNFSIKDTRTAVELINSRYETESSGGITLSSLRAYAECGVDYISIGALTHEFKSLDMSLKAIN